MHGKNTKTKVSNAHKVIVNNFKMAGGFGVAFKTVWIVQSL